MVEQSPADRHRLIDGQRLAQHHVRAVHDDSLAVGELHDILDEGAEEDGVDERSLERHVGPQAVGCRPDAHRLRSHDRGGSRVRSRRGKVRPGVERHAAAFAPSREHIGLADEGGDEARLRRHIDLLGPALLHHHALVHDGDAVGEAERLALVVGHEHERAADLLVDAAQLLLHGLAQLEVEGGERLVEQQHARAHDERARQRHALLLAAGELIDRAGDEFLQPHQRDCLVDAAVDLVLRPLRRA